VNKQVGLHFVAKVSGTSGSSRGWRRRDRGIRLRWWWPWEGGRLPGTAGCHQRSSRTRQSARRPDTHPTVSWTAPLEALSEPGIHTRWIPKDDRSSQGTFLRQV